MVLLEAGILGGEIPQGFQKQSGTYQERERERDLRDHQAAEEMAVAVGDKETANEYRRLFAQGSLWIDEHLFQLVWIRVQCSGWAELELNRYTLL